MVDSSPGEKSVASQSRVSGKANYGKHSNYPMFMSRYCVSGSDVPPAEPVAAAATISGASLQGDSSIS